MKGNLVSIYAGHDANVSFYDAKTNTYHVIELERLVKKDISDFMSIIIKTKFLKFYWM